MINISRNKIPHVGPENADIFILGEAPGSDEDFLGEPFVGKSGEFLTYLLSLAGINRATCRIGNVCNYRPEGNNFDLLRGTSALQEGYEQLGTYLSKHSPKVIIPLGNEALRYLFGHEGISKWRGSVLPFKRSWVVPTYHPAAALRDGTYAPQIEFDFRKAKRVLDHGFTYPAHKFVIDPSPAQFDDFLERVSRERFICADIESVRDSCHVLCCGFSLSSSEAVCIKNHNAFDSGLEPEFAERLRRVFNAAQDVAFHNGLFDTEMLRLNGIEVGDKFRYDTMLAQRVIEPELPIGLDFCASIYTDEPYYKDDGKESGKRIKDTLWEYNCKDCIVTHATRDAQQGIFGSDPVLARDCEFIFSRIPLARSFQRNGIMVDLARRTQLLTAVESRLEHCITISQYACGYKLNLRSPQQVAEILYQKLKLPIRKNHKTGEVTTGEDAIVSLMQYATNELEGAESLKTESGRIARRETWTMKLAFLKSLLEIRGLEKLKSSYFETPMSADGRIRSTYKPAGTDTGRWSCATYVDGSGWNAQTIPRDSLECEEE